MLASTETTSGYLGVSLHSNGAGPLETKNHHHSPIQTSPSELRDSHSNTSINDVCKRRRNLVALSIACLFYVECPQEKSKVNEQGLTGKRDPNAGATIISNRSGPESEKQPRPQTVFQSQKSCDPTNAYLGEIYQRFQFRQGSVQDEILPHQDKLLDPCQEKTQSVQKIGCYGRDAPINRPENFD